MSKKLRVHQTALDNLVSNLRGEVGEIITSWTVWRWIRAQELRIQNHSQDVVLDDPDLNLLGILSSRLYDDIVGRLAELGERKIGRLNFHFAAEKLDDFRTEATTFRRFIEKGEFKAKRNYDIAHKELPEQWDDHRHIHIPDRKVLRAIAMAMRLMKRIDRRVLGPAAPYAWRRARERRYKPMNPPRAGYLLAPHIRLTEAERLTIVVQELAEGRLAWTDMPTSIDGEAVTLKVAKEWGVIHLGDRLIALHEYPVQSIAEIKSRPVDPQAEEDK